MVWQRCRGLDTAAGNSSVTCLSAFASGFAGFFGSELMCFASGMRCFPSLFTSSACFLRTEFMSVAALVRYSPTF